MAEKHLSSQFDEELNSISSRVLEMGGLVESQLERSLYALQHGSSETADQVLLIEQKINRMEVGIDRDITSTMSRRQPTARDLRLLVGVSRTIVNLERAGDEVARMARMVKHIADSGHGRRLPVADLIMTGRLAMTVLRKTLDAFARLDTETSYKIIEEDALIDAEYDGFLRKLITYMMEDPRTISTSLNLLFLAKAIERVGDHAKNIAEVTIYVASGTDVRHTTAAEREQAAQ